MDITVNGCDWQVNIGCRTCISVVELLAILGVTPSRDLNLVLNGVGIPRNELELTPVSNRATLELEGVEIPPDGHSSAIRVPHRRGTGGKA